MDTSASHSELYAWLRLALEPHLGPAQMRQLLATFGLPPHIYAQPVSALNKHLPAPLAAQLHSAPSPELQTRIQQSLDWAAQPQHYILTLADPLYPAALLDLTDPPVVLYAKGHLDQLRYPALAVVGARNASPVGLKNAHDFAQFLAQQGWCIISGLASGIDAAGHQGALAAQQPVSTIAIMGTGMDLVYPSRNRSLAHAIADRGLIVSEFHLGMRALPHHFLRRNRLVAALSKGVLVVEAALKSGSLNTATTAGELGREVFALPGSIHSPLHKGCHRLIRQGAKLVESAEHILEELTPITTAETTSESPTGPAHLALHLDSPALAAIPDHLPAVQHKILHTLGYETLSVDQLQQRSHLTTFQVGAALTQLELIDLVAQQTDGRYVRL